MRVCGEVDLGGSSEAPGNEASQAALAEAWALLGGKPAALSTLPDPAGVEAGMDGMDGLDGLDGMDAVGDTECSAAVELLSRVDRAVAAAVKTLGGEPGAEGVMEVEGGDKAPKGKAGKAAKKAKLAASFSSSSSSSSATAPASSPHAVAASAASLAISAALQKLHRSRALFEWQDGPLVTAMREGHVFVLDEVNLADDAVIERINSVLEGGRSITLAEKGGGSAEKIVAHPRFQLLATMNPGGDFGKRELSPAIRSRVTEIWASAAPSRDDLVLIVREMLALPDVEEGPVDDAVTGKGKIKSKSKNDSAALTPLEVAAIMVDYAAWLDEQCRSKGVAGRVGIREMVAWAGYLSSSLAASEGSGAGAGSADFSLRVCSALVQGALMVTLDGLGLGGTTPRAAIHALQAEALQTLLQACPEGLRMALRACAAIPTECRAEADAARSVLTVGNFSVPLGPQAAGAERAGMDVDTAPSPAPYVLSAQATITSLTRLLRALQSPRPVLLEGPPGVGKSSIIAHLAAMAGHALVRINLSEYTELSDLLGTDLPAPDEGDSAAGAGTATDEGGEGAGAKAKAGGGAQFRWCDGVFLTAMKRGDWVLLDEMNLAPQPVLEGLNACFDHRREVFLPEIGQVVRPGAGFRVFCAQNPMVEGGGRRGLPQSFLSRFSRVYVEAMDGNDMTEIAIKAWAAGGADDAGVDAVAVAGEMVPPTLAAPSVSACVSALIPKMVALVRGLQQEAETRAFLGAPWEFNLRDVFRWLERARDCGGAALLQSGGRDAGDGAMGGEGSGAEDRARRLVSDAAHCLFVCRLRARADQERVLACFSKHMGFDMLRDGSPVLTACVVGGGEGTALGHAVAVGGAILPVHCRPQMPSCLPPPPLTSPLSSGLAAAIGGCHSVLRGQLPRVMEAVAHACRLSWPVLLVGSTGSGKRSAVRQLASLTGSVLHECGVTPSTDSGELLGSFEQSSAERWLQRGLHEAASATLALATASLQLQTVANIGPGDEENDSDGAASMRGLSTAAQLPALQRTLSHAATSCLSQLHACTLAAQRAASLHLLAMPVGRLALEGVHNLLEQVSLAAGQAADELLAARSADSYLLLDACRAEMQSRVGAALPEAQRCLDRARRLATGGTRGGFEWSDGVVVRAMTQGHWLLVDNVNLCSASVLDRLNSLLEPGGTLLLTEAGGARVVVPHPDFRVFLCMDPCHGEISRAMRNRCMELCLLREPELDVAACIARGGAYRGLPEQSGGRCEGLDAAVMQVYRLLHGLPPTSSSSSVVAAAGTASSVAVSASAKRSKSVRAASSFGLLPDHAHPSRFLARVLCCLRLESAQGLGPGPALMAAVEAVLPQLVGAVRALPAVSALWGGGDGDAGMLVGVAALMHQTTYLGPGLPPTAVSALLLLLAMHGRGVGRCDNAMVVAGGSGGGEALLPSRPSDSTQPDRDSSPELDALLGVLTAADSDGRVGALAAEAGVHGGDLAPFLIGELAQALGRIGGLEGAVAAAVAESLLASLAAVSASGRGAWVLGAFCAARAALLDNPLHCAVALPAGPGGPSDPNHGLRLQAHRSPQLALLTAPASLAATLYRYHADTSLPHWGAVLGGGGEGQGAEGGVTSLAQLAALIHSGRPNTVCFIASFKSSQSLELN